MITVYGLLGAPSDALRAAAATADRVVGGVRHLDALSVPDDRRIVLGALRLAVAEIVALPATCDVIVIASGDPLFFGVVRSLRRRGLHPHVVVAPSSIAAAFASVGVPWDDAVVVSAHGRPLSAAVNLARAYPKVAVFTSPENGVRELAAALTDLDRCFVLAERMGEPDERVRVLDAATAAVTDPVQPNVVLVLAQRPDEDDPAWAGVTAGPDRPGLPAVSVPAAVAFARLLPGPGELLRATGSLASDVAALARWAGAAVEPDAAVPRPSGVPGPDVLVADDVAALDGVAPRAVVLCGDAHEPLAAGYRWTRDSVAGLTLSTGVRS